jgi:sensor histidine kinase regulating citrate/malate metabolism
MFKFLTKKLFLPLFWKFSIAITVVVIIFGSINYSLIKNNITLTLENELKHRLIFVVNTLAEQLKNRILVNDHLSIQSIINTAIDNDKTIKFILLVDNKGHITAHSFKDKLSDEISSNYQCVDSCRYETDIPAICHNHKLNVIQTN